MSKTQTANSRSNTRSKNENDDDSNHTGENTESLQGETFVEQITNTTHNKQQNPLQMPEFSFSETVTGQVQNPSVQMQQTFSEVLSSERTQAEKYRSRLHFQRRIGAANQILREKELERNQVLQILNQLHTENQHDDILQKILK